MKIKYIVTQNGKRVFEGQAHIDDNLAVVTALQIAKNLGGHVQVYELFPGEVMCKHNMIINYKVK